MLNSENYFSSENQLKYCGSSQIKDFMKCEAMAMAKIRNEYEQEKTSALLVGSYVDAHFEGSLDLFKAKNPEIFKKDGCLKSEYIQAEEIIQRIERDELFMKYMSGEKQVIKTGEILGMPFKIKIDSYFPKKCIVDGKVMKDMARVYVENQGYMNFILGWGYDIQAAIYQCIEGCNLPFILAVATKEKVTDLALIRIEQETIDTALEIIKAHIPRIKQLKTGQAEPIRCEKCDYCKRTKVLTEIISSDDFE